MAMIANVATVLMLLMFIFGVAVQWNDPDPVRWMAIYGAAAVGCAMYLKGYRYVWFFAAVAIIALIWAATLTGQVIGNVRFGELFEAFEMKDERVEVAREFGGLLIIAFWMLVLTFFTLRTRE